MALWSGIVSLGAESWKFQKWQSKGLFQKLESNKFCNYICSKFIGNLWKLKNRTRVEHHSKKFNMSLHINTARVCSYEYVAVQLTTCHKHAPSPLPDSLYFISMGHTMIRLQLPLPSCQFHQHRDLNLSFVWPTQCQFYAKTQFLSLAYHGTRRCTSYNP